MDEELEQARIKIGRAIAEFIREVPEQSPFASQLVQAFVANDEFIKSAFKQVRRNSRVTIQAGGIDLVTFDGNEIIAARKRRRIKSLLNTLLMLVPAKQRADIECDLRDDAKAMRRARFSEIKIRFYILWQFSWAVWRLYGAKILKLLGVIAVMEKLKL